MRRTVRIALSVIVLSVLVIGGYFLSQYGPGTSDAQDTATTVEETPSL